MMVRSVFLIICLVKVSLGFSDVGKWDLPLSGDLCTFALAKSLFKDSNLYIVLHCGVEDATVSVSYEWVPSECSPDYFHYYDQQLIRCSASNERVRRDANSTEQRGPHKYHCHSRISYNIQADDAAPGDNKQDVSDAAKFSQRPLLTVDREGVYELKVTVSSETKFNVSMEVRLKSPSGYLSAAMWPLWVFFGVMCGAYTALSGAWLLACALRWRELLRLQYWIGGVALLGLLESATFCGVYSAVNSSGYFNVHAYMLAEWLSLAKRALARMLVIIVSLGFGIVKPRLGPALQRVLGVGALWFALAAVNAWLRLARRAGGSNRLLLLSEAPLSLLDSAICWWGFVSLAHTMRTLQLRRSLTIAPSNRLLLLSEAPLSLLDSAICWWGFVSLAHTMRTLQLRRSLTIAPSNRLLLLSEAPLSLLDSAICWWGFVSLAHTMRTLQLRRSLTIAPSNRLLLLSEAPLSLLDSAICWWGFVSLAHTMRTLQLRRNAIKLTLYRHFTNTLIFAVISSVVFMLYSIKSYRVLDCIRMKKNNS
ncbi:transmembrane protein 87A isoform X2 [Amyelois transitella]|uniref:transmembrane protein 87A isoform X2 n=1 Tax=Amyelois transitella TaxID=680683 RepID=UPI00298FAFFA|nr:transmembrane protein 87A isoform X2 [Amyelois transitella]